ncbi:hd-gyp domain [hydrocarbon metagenome]|uniref:Hd-gyp domain n=1 Tax=hydrocarbon metagenome TaxID=938273 RepID=A0A0W8E408_9ZZZZ
MDTKSVVLTGLIITALVTGIILVDILPVFVLALIALLAGLGVTYYAGLSSNRIEYISEQRLLLEFNKKLVCCRELSEVERISEKYAARIVSCESVVVFRSDKASTGEDDMDNSFNSLGRWVEDNKTVLIIDEQNTSPADLNVPVHIQSLLAIPIRSRLDCCGVLLMMNKKEQGAFTVRQIEMLEIIAMQAAEIISRLVEHRNQQVYQLNLLKALVKAIEGRENGFAGHSERVADISCLLGGRLGLNADDMRDLYYSALLHDIGKLRLDGTLNAEIEDSLDREDHSGRGALILRDVPGVEIIRESILYHHERYDGSGVPQGLAATDIPFNARIIAVADIYDAMTRLCSEEERLSPGEALQAVKKGSGSVLDPLVVVALEEVETELAGWEKDQQDK